MPTRSAAALRATSANSGASAACTRHPASSDGAAAAEAAPAAGTTVVVAAAMVAAAAGSHAAPAAKVWCYGGAYSKRHSDRGACRLHVFDPGSGADSAICSGLCGHHHTLCQPAGLLSRGHQVNPSVVKDSEMCAGCEFSRLCPGVEREALEACCTIYLCCGGVNMQQL